MKKNRAVLLLLTAICSSPRPATAAEDSLSLEEPSAQTPEQDAESNLIRKNVALEREKINPLYEQERTEIQAVRRDGSRSEPLKRSAIKKIKRDFLEKRNAIRLKSRMELRSVLLKRNAPTKEEK